MKTFNSLFKPEIVNKVSKIEKFKQSQKNNPNKPMATRLTK